MHVQNEPREDHRSSAAGTVPAPQSSTTEDASIRWSRDPVDIEDKAADSGPMTRHPAGQGDESTAVGVAHAPTAQESPAPVEQESPALAEQESSAPVEQESPARTEQESPAPTMARSPATAVEDRTAPVGYRTGDEGAAHESAGTDRLAETPHPAQARETDEELAASEDRAVAEDRAVSTEAEAEAEAEAGDGGPAAAGNGELMPGSASAPPLADLWGDGDAQRFQDRWREVQLRFVDDPRAAAQEAEALVGEAIDGFTAALAARREELAHWRSNSADDTEELRMAVRRYRQFLDRVIAR